ncbi:MAG: hypothetical protein IT454_07075 [Planctomycetes bacterium]|nr:hypothetical protein [Planctomycetota bacterium]
MTTSRFNPQPTHLPRIGRPRPRPLFPINPARPAYTGPSTIYCTNAIARRRHVTRPGPSRPSLAADQVSELAAS